MRQANILIDKDGIARIGGLGNACILPDVTEPACPTKADDMYAFGFVAWEVCIPARDVVPLTHSGQVFTGRTPPPGPGGTAPARSSLSGSGLSRPDHHEVSDLVWQIIKGCWHRVASKRMVIGRVVALLEAELSRISASGA